MVGDGGAATAVPAGFEQAGAVGAEPDHGGRPVGPAGRPQHGAVGDQLADGAVAADEYHLPAPVDDQPDRLRARRCCPLGLAGARVVGDQGLVPWEAISQPSGDDHRLAIGSYGDLGSPAVRVVAFRPQLLAGRRAIRERR